MALVETGRRNEGRCLLNVSLDKAWEAALHESWRWGSDFFAVQSIINLWHCATSSLLSDSRLQDFIRSCNSLRSRTP